MDSYELFYPVQLLSGKWLVMEFDDRVVDKLVMTEKFLRVYPFLCSMRLPGQRWWIEDSPNNVSFRNGRACIGIEGCSVEDISSMLKERYGIDSWMTRQTFYGVHGDFRCIERIQREGCKFEGSSWVDGWKRLLRMVDMENTWREKEKETIKLLKSLDGFRRIKDWKNWNCSVLAFEFNELWPNFVEKLQTMLLLEMEYSLACCIQGRSKATEDSFEWSMIARIVISISKSQSNGSFEQFPTNSNCVYHVAFMERVRQWQSQGLFQLDVYQEKFLLPIFDLDIPIDCIEGENIHQDEFCEACKRLISRKFNFRDSWKKKKIVVPQKCELPIFGDRFALWPPYKNEQHLLDTIPKQAALYSQLKTFQQHRNSTLNSNETIILLSLFYDQDSQFNYKLTTRERIFLLFYIIRKVKLSDLTSKIATQEVCLEWETVYQLFSTDVVKKRFPVQEMFRMDLDFKEFIYYIFPTLNPITKETKMLNVIKFYKLCNGKLRRDEQLHWILELISFPPFLNSNYSRKENWRIFTELLSFPAS